jgi:hypothetical protein
LETDYALRSPTPLWLLAFITVGSVSRGLSGERLMLQIKDLVLLDIGIPGDSFFLFYLNRKKKKKGEEKE